MERCPYRDIVPDNLPIEVARKVVQKYDVVQCPYSRGRVVCKECEHEMFLDENAVERLTRNITYKHLTCRLCGTFFNITKDVEVVCIAGECLLAQEK